MTTKEAVALESILETHRPRPGEPANILRTLLAIQQRLGHVPHGAIAPISDALAVPQADVAGVLSYYPDLHTMPRGRHVVRLCLGEACVANRSPRLLADLRRELGIGLGETTSDREVTLERVYCLGNCAVGPTVMVDDTIYGRVIEADLRKILSTK